MTKEIEKAERDLNNLEDQRESLIHRAKLLSKSREAVAFAALTGDKTAKAKLAEINAEDASHGTSIASVDAALTVARQNLANAKAAAAGAADRDNALQTRTLLEKFKALGNQADDAARDYSSSILEMREVLTQMHQLGVTAPTDQMFRINAVAAIKTTIQQLPNNWINDFEFMRLAPSQKKSFKQIVGSWYAQISNQISARLGEKLKETA